MFYHKDFETQKEKVILGPIPNKEEFEKEKIRICSLRKSISLEMLPCYEEPILNREQEFHLFRQMNYLKFKMQRLKTKKTIERYSRKIKEIRNLIASSNFRLAVNVLKKHIYYNHKSNENFLSDAYFDVLKAVDYFNFTLGNKFSTYCIWVIKKNFFRDSKIDSNTPKFACLSENCDIEEKREPEGENENNLILEKLINLAKEKSRTKNVFRQIDILENYYGLNGKSSKTLEEISQIFGITKERVRQLKEKFIESMKNAATELRITSEVID